MKSDKSKLSGGLLRNITLVKWGISFLFCLFIVLPHARAQGPAQVPSTNIYDKYFRLTVCDGPKIPAELLKKNSALIPTDPQKFLEKFGHPPPYNACDFNYAMIQVQHLINLAIILGVLLAVVLFSYAGYLFVLGTPASISKGREIFRRVFLGFLAILVAWFVVYQILDWLTGNSGFSALLGKPL